MSFKQNKVEIIKSLITPVIEHAKDLQSYTNTLRPSLDGSHFLCNSLVSQLEAAAKTLRTLELALIQFPGMAVPIACFDIASFDVGIKDVDKSVTIICPCCHKTLFSANYTDESIKIPETFHICKEAGHD